MNLQSLFTEIALGEDSCRQRVLFWLIDHVIGLQPVAQLTQIPLGHNLIIM